MTKPAVLLGSSKHLGDPASDVLRYGRRPLDAFFSPSSVAVIGATDKAGSVGRTILTNLIATPFGGTVYPVNPNRPSVLGIHAYPDVASIPEQVELAVIVTPPKSIPGLVAECGRAGCKAVIVISAGFKEVGPEGADLERQVAEQARLHGIRLVGPNCLGVMSPVTGLNATFAAAMAPAGRVAFVSQSGALLTAVFDWALRERVGFSRVVSLGSMADVGWGDCIYHLGDDRKTECIILYMETVGDARAFLSAAREVALTKPIIVMKPGRTAEAAKAAASHTGSLAGSDEVLDAAFRRAGVLRADDDRGPVFNLAEILGKQPRPRGKRLTILTNAGGPGVLATDALIGGGGLLAPLMPETIEKLNAVLPATWTHANPIDIIGDAPPERYAAALEISAKDPTSDGLLVILTPQAMTDPTKTAQELVPFARIEGKPVMASWMGGRDVEKGAGILREAGIPTFPYPDAAARKFNDLWRYTDNLHALYETPSLSSDEESVLNRDRAAAIVAAARDSGRTILSEFESKDLLAAYGIPVDRDPRRGDRGSGRRRGSGHRLPGRPQALFPHHHAQDRCRRRATEPGRRGRRARRVPRNRDIRRREGGRRALRGRHRPADDQLDRLRADRRQHDRRAVRTGPAVRDRRPAGRGLQGPRAGAPAADHHARAPDDGAHQDLRSPEGRARAAIRRPGRARAAARPLQPARGRAAVDQRDRHQPAARLAGADRRARRSRHPATRDRDTGETCRGRPFAPTRASTSRPGPVATGHPS